MEYNAREQRKARVWRRAGGAGGGPDPDLEETWRLASPGTAGAADLGAADPAARRAMAETLPVGGGPQVGAPGPGFDGDDVEGGGGGADAGGVQYGAPGFGIPGFGGVRAGRVSRRVLFAAGGLAVVGGCAVAVASQLSSSGSSPAAGSPASGGASPPAGAGAAVPVISMPADLSSSTGDASPPPDVSNPGSGIDPSKVQSAPEYYVHAGPKVIALTLDDGPSPVYTPQILALLQEHKITATFCMIGQQIAANRSLVSEVAAAGHTIVNHTWDHSNQSKLTLPQIRSQISRASDALSAVGVRPAVFRAPYGAWSHAVFEACAAADLRPLDWSVDPRDWSRPGVSTIVSRILSNTRTGSIILDHDGGGDRSQTVAALRIVLPQLLQAGYRFTTV